MAIPTTLGAAILVLGSIYISYYLIKRLRKDEIKRDTANTIGQIFVGCMAFSIVMAFVPVIGQLFWQAELPIPSVGPTVTTPGETVTAGRQGFVIATARDAHLLPLTMLPTTAMYVSLDEPVVGPWTSLVTDNTGATGSVQLTVPGVISGMVYVTAGRTGYYPEYTRTTIPGAEVVAPDLSADLELSRIGSLAWTLTDNSNAYMEGTDNIVENVTTSTGAYFTMRLYSDNAYMALKNLRILMVRGDAWTTLGASVAPVVLDSAGTVVTVTGDITMTVAVSGQFDFLGNITYGYMIEIKVTTAVTSAALGTMAKLYIDDLSGLRDVLGGTGISEKIITIKTVV